MTISALEVASVEGADTAFGERSGAAETGAEGGGVGGVFGGELVAACHAGISGIPAESLSRNASAKGFSASYMVLSPISHFPSRCKASAPAVAHGGARMDNARPAIKGAVSARRSILADGLFFGGVGTL